MMSEKQFIESQKECASMLGMSLSEYEKYCKNLKVPTESNIIENESNDDKTIDLLNYLEIDKNLLKRRKDN